MSEQKISRENLLSSLLKALVNEWGHTAVRQCLDALSEPNATQSSEISGSSKQRSRGKTDKPTAAALAEKISVPPGHLRLIATIAERYDRKLFLPTAGDIRYFFEVHGEATPSIKHRSDAFRRVLKVLSTMQEDALRQMIEDEAYSGPSQLQPLSEAMRDVGERRPLGGDPADRPASSSANDVGSDHVGTDEPPHDPTATKE
jgi:hypothetical protein